MAESEPVAALADGTRMRFRQVAAVAFVIALSIRLASISTVLPLIHHPDEPTNEHVVVRVAREPTMSPVFFHYPTLLFYVQAAVLRTFEVVTRTHVDPAHVVSSGNARTTAPGYWIAARTVTALLGSGLVAMAAWFAAVVTESSSIGVVVGAWAAFSPLLVEDSRYLTPDTYAAFFVMAALVGAVRIAEGATWRGYVFTGAMVGLAAGSKYNTALVSVAVIVAHFGRGFRRGLTDVRLVLAGMVSVVVFFMASPFVVFDYAHFRKDFLFEQRHYERGHLGAEGNSFAFNALTLWESEHFRLLGLRLLVFVRERRVLRATLTLLSFSVAYLALLSGFKVHFYRNLVPVMAPLLVLSGLGLSAALRRLDVPAKRAQIALAAAAVLFTIQPALAILATIHERRIDRRAPAELWIANHLPAGASVVVEAYGPWVDPNRYQVRGTSLYSNVAPRQLRQWHARYVVLVEEAYGRLYGDPAHHRRELARYGALLKTHCEVADFRPADGEPMKIVDLQCRRPK
ncbi:MAG TPA: glycosyltransferase family 39 protein [Polyangiaceae bacterium]|nr:glycosyltransferase family 39 protein [Polyangiaceae bacterium]